MRYSYSKNGEDFYGDFDEPYKAAAQGFFAFMEGPTIDELQNFSLFVGENREPDLSCPIDAKDAINKLFDSREDFFIEPAENFCVTPEQEKDLTKRFVAAWDSWIAENKIEAGFHVVENVKEWVLEFSGEKLGDCGTLKFVEKKD